MNQHTESARAWLDRRYSRDSQGGYLAHQPIHGLRTERAEPNWILRFARTGRLLELLHTLEFDSVLDVGGGEGYLAALVRDLFGAGTVHSSDLSAQACLRAREIFGIRGAAADSNRLPFADRSYDVVLCSEVLEHLSRPVLAISELARIARKYVVVTTAEFCPAGELERGLRGLTLDRSYPHSEVNWFTAGDFRGLLGESTALSAQYRNLEHLLPGLDGTAEQIETILALLMSSHTLDVDHAGVIVISARDGAPMPNTAMGPTSQQRRRILNRLLNPPARRADNGAEDTGLDAALVDRLECVRCRGAIARSSALALICGRCSQVYDVKDGVPSMFVAAADEPLPQTLEEECVARLSGGDPHRAGAVRRVIGKLHHNETRHNSPWKQKAALQMLRLVWLWSRQESTAAKLARLLGRLAGRPPAGSDEVRNALSGVKWAHD
jgi:SAM-dependent methyltransferase